MKTLWKMLPASRRKSRKNTLCRQMAQGFTLIELVIVITIVAILAAVALPRLIDAQKDARTAKANAIFGSIRSATSLARSRCELDLSRGTGGCTATGGTVNMDTATVDMVYKHPAASASGIERAAAISLTADGLNAVAVGGSRRFDVVGGTTGTCSITYTEASASASPVIALDVSGC